MDASIGEQLFYMIALGLTIGFVSHYIFGSKGVDLVPSILLGLAGSLVTGLTALILGFEMALSYSFIGTIAFIFLGNVFRQEGRKVFVDTDHSDSHGEES